MADAVQANQVGAIAGNPTEKPKKVYPDIATVKAVCPNATEKDIATHLPFILRAMVKKNMTSRNQLIAMIATIYTETGGIRSISEYGGKSADYAPYYGRGYIQLTHDYNYRAFAKYSGVDVVNNRDAVLQPELSAESTLWYWCGGPGNKDIRPYAEKGDWQNVRSIVNRGSPGRWGSCNGKDVFSPAIERGIKYFQSGIDPSSIDLNMLPGSYGMGCIDTNGAPLRSTSNINGVGSLADALVQALNLAELGQFSIRFKGILDPHAQPEILKLRPGQTFEVRGVGDKLNGNYVAKSVIIFGDPLEVEVIGKMPDPDAPPAQVFLNNVDASLVNPAIAPVTGSGDYSSRIWAAAQAARGKSSAAGPEGGNKACAYMVNRACLIPAGIKPLGGGQYGSNAVAGCLEDLKNNKRGVQVEASQTVPGDIWMDGRGSAHIGIVSAPGAARILSNSSSKAAFVWEDTPAAYSKYYHGAGDQYWRVVSG